jgi:AraC-like DNA-binding protein
LRRLKQRNDAVALLLVDPRMPEIAGVGVPTLHHHFRMLTARSPLQYQKQLRLQAARGRILMDGLDVASTAVSSASRRCGIFERCARRARRRWSH